MDGGGREEGGNEREPTKVKKPDCIRVYTCTPVCKKPYSMSSEFTFEELLSIDCVLDPEVCNTDIQ